MSTWHDLALVALPKSQRIENEGKNNTMLTLVKNTIKPRTTDDIILLTRVEDNKAKAQAAVKAFRAKKYAQDRVLTQAQIDTRLPDQVPEREITRRLKQIGA